MPTKLDHLRITQLQDLLKPRPDLQERLFPTIGIPTIPRPFTHTSRPQSDSVEALSHVDHDAHDLVVVVVFEGFSDSSELGVEPERIDVDGSLIFERVGPLPAVLVLGVFPFWSDALFEEVVVGFETEVAAWCDVVLDQELSAQKSRCEKGIREM